MAKTKKLGRPQGAKKKPMNVFIEVDRAQKLRVMAAKEQKTISIMVENALESTYGI